MNSLSSKLPSDFTVEENETLNDPITIAKIGKEVEFSHLDASLVNYFMQHQLSDFDSSENSVTAKGEPDIRVNGYEMVASQDFSLESHGTTSSLRYESDEIISKDGNLTGKYDTYSKRYIVKIGSSKREFVFASQKSALDFTYKMHQLKSLNNEYIYRKDDSGTLTYSKKDGSTEETRHSGYPDVPRQPKFDQMGIKIVDGVLIYRQEDSQTTTSPTVNVNAEGGIEVGIKTETRDYRQSHYVDPKYNSAGETTQELLHPGLISAYIVDIINS